ncbi:MAG: hypothetical protein AB8G96_07710 [Phycisphaerales bacterium]
MSPAPTLSPIRTGSRCCPPVIVVATVVLTAGLGGIGAATASSPVGSAEGIFGDEFERTESSDRPITSDRPAVTDIAAADEGATRPASADAAFAPQPIPAPPGLPAFEVEPDGTEADAPRSTGATGAADRAVDRRSRVTRTAPAPRATAAAPDRRRRGADTPASQKPRVLSGSTPNRDTAPTNLGSARVDLAAASPASPNAPAAIANGAQTPRVQSEFTGSMFHDCMTENAETGRLQLDAACVLDRLRDRYLSLVDHREAGWLTEEYHRAGQTSSQRTETRVDCSFDRGTVSVSTPARRVAGGLLGRLFPVRVAPVTGPASRAVDQWIAPHAALGDADGSIGLPPAAAGSITFDAREMVRLDLEDADDRVELFVNPDTMLVEFVRERRSLPDGGTYRAELDIITSPSAPVAVTDAADVTLDADAEDEAGFEVDAEFNGTAFNGPAGDRDAAPVPPADATSEGAPADAGDALVPPAG